MISVLSRNGHKCSSGPGGPFASWPGCGEADNPAPDEPGRGPWTVAPECWVANLDEGLGPIGDLPWGAVRPTDRWAAPAVEQRQSSFAESRLRKNRSASSRTLALFQVPAAVSECTAPTRRGPDQGRSLVMEVLFFNPAGKAQATTCTWCQIMVQQAELHPASREKWIAECTVLTQDSSPCAPN
jgi:hypothetical protein